MKNRVLAVQASIINLIIEGMDSLPIVVYPQPTGVTETLVKQGSISELESYLTAPYRVGDHIQILEPFAFCTNMNQIGVAYQSDRACRFMPEANQAIATKGTQVHRVSEGFAIQDWLPPLQMPKWASRITLLVENLNIVRASHYYSKTVWRDVGMNPHIPFKNNPWTWKVDFNVIEFKKD